MIAMKTTQTREVILAPSEAALISLQATVRKLTGVIAYSSQILAVLQERNDPKAPVIEKVLRDEEQRLQSVQADLASLIQARTATIEAIERAGG